MAPHFAPQQAVHMQPEQQQGAGSTPPAHPVLPLSFLESAPSLDSKLASFSKSSPRLAAGIEDITHGRSALSPSIGSNSFGLRMGSMTHSMGTETPVTAGGSLLPSSGSLQAPLPRAVSSHKALQTTEPAASLTGIKHSPWQEDSGNRSAAPVNGKVHNWEQTTADALQHKGSQPAVRMQGPAQTAAQSLKKQQQGVTVEQLQQQLQELQLKRQAQTQAATSINPAWDAPSNPMTSVLDPLLSSTVTASHQELVQANLKRSTSGVLRSAAPTGNPGGLQHLSSLQHVDPSGLPKNRTLGSHQLSVTSAMDEAEVDRASTGSRSLLRTVSSRRGAYPELATGLWQQASSNTEEQENCITVSGPTSCTPTNGVSITRSVTAGHCLPSMSTISELGSLPSASAAAPSIFIQHQLPSASSPRFNSMVTSVPSVDVATSLIASQNLGMQVQHTKSQGHNMTGIQSAGAVQAHQPTQYTGMREGAHSGEGYVSSFSLSHAGSFGLMASGHMDNGHSFCSAQPSGAKFKVRTSLQDVPVGSVQGVAAGVAVLPSPSSSKAALSSYQVHD